MNQQEAASSPFRPGCPVCHTPTGRIGERCAGCKRLRVLVNRKRFAEDRYAKLPIPENLKAMHAAGKRWVAENKKAAERSRANNAPAVG